jgi:hypothetical protein
VLRKGDFCLQKQRSGFSENAEKRDAPIAPLRKGRQRSLSRTVQNFFDPRVQQKNPGDCREQVGD